jgi:exodeoxyribonuclease V alpha subunit
MEADLLAQLHHHGVLNETDAHFARFMARLCRSTDPALLLAAALCCHVTGQGDICLSLESQAGRRLIEAAAATGEVRCPELADWSRRLAACAVVGAPGEEKPLILDRRYRLYLYRYWNYEQQVVRSIHRRAREPAAVAPGDAQRIRGILQRLFPGGADSPIDWQRIAAAVAVLKHFCIITGGPGTGKTHTVSAILALLVELAGEPVPRIRIAAPTGKAAGKLSDALKQARRQLPGPAWVRQGIPDEARTLHSLLRPVAGTPYFRYGPDRPLPADVVVVDEASMVDLALMAKLLQALPDSTRLILLGDRDQLASVEAGAVLADLCGGSAGAGFSADFARLLQDLSGCRFPTEVRPVPAGQELGDSVVVLQKSFRFDSSGGIGDLSTAVKHGAAEQALETLRGPERVETGWRPLRTPAELVDALQDTLTTAGIGDALDAEDPLEALARLNRLQLLCAMRRGPWGVASVNRIVEQLLMRSGRIRPEILAGQAWYRGKPVLVTGNDYRLNLFNGDLGVTAATDVGGSRRYSVCFPGPDGSVRRIPPHRIAACETAWALTVHKSQGSEFDRVVLILPDRDGPLLTRELIYTAVTRARQSVCIWGSEPVLLSAVRRRTRRVSGLRDALWH